MTLLVHRQSLRRTLEAHNGKIEVPPDFFHGGTVLRQGARVLIFRAVEDADLIGRTKKGDVEAFNLLISRWEKRVYNYLLRLTSNPDDSLDLSQDVFLKAYQNIRKLDDAAKFPSWLFRIAHNEAHSLFRKRKPEVDVNSPDFVEREAGHHFSMDLTLAVNAALDRLNPDQREAVVLKVYQGFKFDEMAEILGCPVSTVKSRLYTALDLLKTELSPASRGAQ